MNDIAIKVENVSKSFKLPHERHGSLKSLFVNLFRRRKTYEKQRVLKDISFEIKKGEFFGIVGRNGSGKSTLLKLLAGVYTPEKGAIHINGKLTPFIELGVGFNPELTGRENVFLNGALLGFSRKEMSSLYDEIVTFAELEKFMDQKLKNYSSGMQVRLAFSIAIRAKSEILLLDEVLAVGDESFQRKCYSYFAQLKRNKQTVVFVSHDMGAVRDYCTSGVLINNGELIVSGEIKEVVNKYTELNLVQAEKQLSDTKEETHMRWGNGQAEIDAVWTSLKGAKKQVFGPAEAIEANIHITAKADIPNPVVGMQIQDEQGRVVFATNTNELQKDLKTISKNKSITATFTIDNVYTNGNYTISCAVANKDRTQVFSRVEEINKFAVSGRSSSMQHSITHPDHSFKIK